MRPLGCGLFAEGDTDYQFFPPLLTRLVQDACDGVLQKVGVAPVQSCTFPKDRKENFYEHIARRAREFGHFNIYFIHKDGDGDPHRALRHGVTPIMEAIDEALPASNRRFVPVIPERTMEAWCLADGHALREVFRCKQAIRDLDIPDSPAKVELLKDPKQKLINLAERCSPRRSSHCWSHVECLSELGDVISLEALRQVPAFQTLENSLREALRELNYIR